MRRLATILFLFGLVTGVVGTVVGCGSFFAWNGRHPVAFHPLTPGSPTTVSFDAKAGRRYTVGVQAAFERAGLPEQDGLVVVDARMPLVVTLTDDSGTRVLDVAGWLDPGEPQTVVLGRGQEERSPQTAAGEVVAERFIGPYPTNAAAKLRADVSLGEDRVGRAKLRSARLVVYDDAILPSIVAAFAAAGLGALAFIVGSGMLLAGIVRRRSRRGGIRSRSVV